MATNTTSGNKGAKSLRLALGSVQFGLAYGVANRVGQVSHSEAKEIIQTARLAGVGIIDTAIGYGSSETSLGNIGVKDFQVVTKLPGLPDGLVDVRSWVEKEFFQALHRLRLTRIYGLLLHRPSDLSGSNGAALWTAMTELKSRQLVEKIGISIYEPAELSFLTACFDINLVQAPFNLLDQRLKSSGWLARLKQKNIEVHTRSAFLQGLLLLPREEIPSKFERWNDLWIRWHKWLKASDTSALQACLNFPLSFEHIDRVVVGADSAEQFRQILEVLALPLAKELPDLTCHSEDLINPAIWPTF